jgi:hypothetical protein
MSKEFVARNGLIALDNSTITGSLTVTGGITGSLLGTASFASTSSFVDVSGSNVFAQGGNSFGTQALLGTNDNQNLAFETSGSVRMFVSSSGIVSIANNLMLSNGGFIYGDTNTPFLQLNNTLGSKLAFGSTNYIDVGGATTIVNNNVNIIRFRNTRIVATAKTFIGAPDVETDPSARLQVRGSGATSSTTALRIENSNASASLVVLDNGNVGIERASPLKELDILGQIAVVDSLNNTVVGFQSMDNNLAQYSTAFGYRALFSNTLGSSNTAIGFTSLYSNSTGVSNISIGNATLRENTSGSYNIGIGDSAVRYITTGSLHNIGIGHTALAGAGSSLFSNNVAVGGFSLVNNLTGNNSIAIGYAALYTSQIGTENTAVGHTALYSNTSGSFNTAIGHKTLELNTTGNYNVALGYRPLTNNRVGAHNIGIGHFALQYNVSGSYNIALGQYALWNVTGSYNIGIGTNAGAYTITGSNTNTGSLNSIFIGFNTRTGGDNSSNEIVIGHEASGSGTNTVTIGNNSITRTILRGNVGIGTTSPTTRLQVRGSGATSSTTALLVENSSLQETLQVRDDGAVKIGSGSYGHPANTRFQVNDMSGATVLRLDTLTLFTPLTIQNNGSNGLIVNGNPSLILQAGNGNNGTITIGNSVVNNVAVSNQSRNFILTNQNWNAVSGSSNLTMNMLHINNNINFVSSSGTNIARGLYINPVLTGVSDFRAIETTSGDILFQSGSSPLLFVSESGNIGIGTTNPTFRLDVSGSARLTSGSQLRIDDSTGGNYTRIQNRLIVFSRTNGTSEAVSIDGSSDNLLNIYARSGLTLRGGGSGVNVMRIDDEGGANGNASVLITGTSTGPNSGSLQVRNSSNTQVFKTFDGGSVAVGTITTPTARLQVKGSGVSTLKTFLVEDSNSKSNFVVLDNGRVGINIADPTQTGLSISGSINIFDGLLNIDGTAVSPYGVNYGYKQGLYVGLGGTRGTQSTILGNSVFPGSGSSTVRHTSGDVGSYIRLGIGSGITFHTNITSSLDVDIAETTNEVFRVTQTGNVGIGTTTPSENLHVSGNILIGNYGPSLSLLRFANVSNVGNSAYIGRTAAVGFEINGGSVGDFRIQIPAGTDTAALTLYGNGVNTAQFFRNQRIRFGGNLTTNPSSTLEIIGAGADSSTTSLLIRNSTPTSILTVTNDGRTELTQNTGFNSTLTDGALVLRNPNGNSVALGVTSDSILRVKLNTGWGINFIAGSDQTLIQGNRIFSFNTALRIGGNLSNSTSATNSSVLISDAITMVNSVHRYNALSITTPASSSITNGLVRGLFINPTFSGSVDYRAIETTAGNILFQSGSSPLLFVSESGRVGIGTNTPVQNLEVIGTSYFSGRMGIGASYPSNTVGLTVTSQITGGVIAYGIAQRGFVQNDVTLYAGGIQSQLNKTGAGTLPTYYNFLVNGGGSIAGAVTNQMGYTVLSSFTEATNNYGFYGDLASATGVWNLYMNGTADNYLAGRLGIGTTSPSARLQVRGSGATSSTTALRVEDSNASASIITTDDRRTGFYGDTYSNGLGGLRINSNVGTNSGGLSIFSDAIRFNQSGFLYFSQTTSVSSTGAFRLQNTNTFSPSTGTAVELGIGSTFAPSSGNGAYNTLLLNPTISQSLASGSIRGLYYNPIITSLSGSHRAIETTSGDILFQSGSTPLFFVSQSGNIGIGKTTPNARLDISGSAIISGSLTVTEGITGSLFGTASFVTSASFATQANNTTFIDGYDITNFILTSGNQAKTGSLDISGSLSVTGTVRIDNQAGGTPTEQGISAGVVSNYWGTEDGKFLSTPAVWLTINLDGTTYYLPAYG